MNPHELVREARSTGDNAKLRVYADWLEEQGRPERALLIQLQCDHADVATWDRRALELGWEIDALLARHGDALRCDLPILDGVDWTHFDRGHVSAVRVRDLEALEQHGDAIAAAAPVTSVELMSFDGWETAKVDVPWLEVLRVHAAGGATTVPLLSIPRALEIVVGNYDGLEWMQRDDDAPLERLSIVGGSDVGRELAEALVNRPWAKRITWLLIPTRYVDDNTGYAVDPRLGATGARALTKLAGLEHLNVDRQRIGAAFAKVAALPELRSLSARECGCDKLAFGAGAPMHELDLSRNAIGNAGARVIAHAPRLAELRRLVLDTCEIESAGLADLTESPLWQSLRCLDLSRNPLGASAIRVLIDAAPPAQLHTLGLADMDLDDRGGAALAKVAWLGQLAVLDLSGNILRQGAAGLRAFAPDRLRRLALASVGLERAEASAIARFWPFLVELELSGNALTDAGLERFVTMKPAPALQTLGLRDCALSAEGVELLASHARCPRLRTLDLAGNRPSGGLAALLASPFVSQLQSLDLSRCALAPADITALVRAVPPRLRRLNLRDNELDQASLLALAGSPALAAVPTVLLDGNPWSFSPAVRDQLARRFGPHWAQPERS